MTKEQIALRSDVKVITDGITNLLAEVEKRLASWKNSGGPSRYKPDINEAFANHLGTLRHDVNQLMEARNKIENEVDLRFTRVADRLGRVESQMAAILGNGPLPNNSWRLLKAKKDKTTRLLPQGSGDSF